MVLGFVVSQDEPSVGPPGQPAAIGDSKPNFKEPPTIKSVIKTITLTGGKSRPVCTAAMLHTRHGGTGQWRVVPIFTAESEKSPWQSTWPTHWIGLASRAVNRLTWILIPDSKKSIPCANGCNVREEVASGAVEDGWWANRSRGPRWDGIVPRITWSCGVTKKNRKKDMNSRKDLSSQ